MTIQKKMRDVGKPKNHRCDACLTPSKGEKNTKD